MPSGAAQPAPSPTPAQTSFMEEEPVEVKPTDDLADALAEFALSVFNTTLALL